MRDHLPHTSTKTAGNSDLAALRLVLDQISEAVIRTDSEFRILDWSATAERMYGYSSEEAVGSRFTDIVRTRYQHTDYDTVLAHFRERGHWHGEAIQIGKHGKELRVLASVTALHDAGGAPAGVLAINRDVTEAYLRDAALRESELRFRQFAENSRDVFWMSDLHEHRMVFVSDGYERVWGRSRASLYEDPSSFMEAIHPDDRPRVQAALDRQLEGAASSVEYRVIRPDGSERWIHDQAFPIRSEDGGIRRVAGIARDVTELRAAERKRKELEAQVQQAQRLESLGVLAAGMAHDYNNLLMGIIGNLDLALLRADDVEVVRGNIERAKRDAYAMAELTKQLVLYAGEGHARAATATWNEVLVEMSGLLETSLGRQARLDLRISSESQPICIDDKQARIVLLNLVTNAAEAIGDEEGTVVVETRSVDVDEAAFRLRRPDLPARSGRYSCLRVSDDGCGIPESDLERVFDPFFSTKFQGRGMGLASVYGIVRESGGWLTVDSQEGKGSTFSVYLPVDGDCSDGRTSAPPRPRVLIAENELFVRQVLADMFDGIGYDVETAREGEEALAHYHADPDAFDLLALDLNLPKMSGLDVRAAIREHDRSVPIMICTGGSSPQIATVLAEDPHCALLAKPFTMDDLARCVSGLTHQTESD